MAALIFLLDAQLAFPSSACAVDLVRFCDKYCMPSSASYLCNRVGTLQGEFARDVLVNLISVTKLSIVSESPSVNLSVACDCSCVVIAATNFLNFFML